MFLLQGAKQKNEQNKMHHQNNKKQKENVQQISNIAPKGIYQKFVEMEQQRKREAIKIVSRRSKTITLFTHQDEKSSSNNEGKENIQLQLQKLAEKEKQLQTLAEIMKQIEKEAEAIRKNIKNEVGERKMSESEIQNKINSFFVSFRSRASASNRPRASFSDQYEKCIDNGREWINTSKLDICGTLHAFGCLANTAFDPECMDFSFGGPSFAISEFMECVDEFIDDLIVEDKYKNKVRTLFEKLDAYHKKWDAYGYGDEIKRTLDNIKEQWSF